MVGVRVNGKVREPDRSEAETIDADVGGILPSASKRFRPFDDSISMTLAGEIEGGDDNYPA